MYFFLVLQPQLFFFFVFCVPSYISGVHHSSSSSAFPAISLGFTIPLLLHYQLYLWGPPFFFFCITSYISGVHHSSSSALPAISLGFTILLFLLLHSGVHHSSSSAFPSYISGVHYSSSSSVFPSYISGVHHSSFSSSAFPSYIFGVHHSSSSVFPAISLASTILLLLLHPQLYLWGSPFFLFFFYFPQLYLWGSPFFFFCIPSYISGVHHSSSSSSAFPSYISGDHHSGWDFSYVTVVWSNHWGSHIPSSWMVHAGCVFVGGNHPSRTWMLGSLEYIR